MAENQVALVKQKTDIVEVVGERVALKRAGRNFKGLCPFHAEKTPSFFVSAELQMYKCFGCGENGDVISFVQDFEGLSFPEALEQLAKRAGVKLERVYRTGEDKQREKLLEILHLTAEYYHYLLMKHPAGEEARKYLKKRKVHKRSMLDYQMGYAPESWDGLQKYLVKRKKYRVQDLESVGLVIRSRTGRRGYYDRFRGRVMFPQMTYAGQVVGFAGRVLDPEVKEAKYINSPETSLYHKGELLFGMSQAKGAIRKNDRVVVVEGELDVISSHQAGVKEVVAVKGSALSEEQVLLIRRLTRNVVLALDADEAGQQAIVRAIEVGEKQEVNLKVVQLSGGKDPDDIAREDGAGWKNMVKNAVSVYQFYINWAFSQYDAASGTGQKQISKFVVPVLNRIENGVERTYYTKQLADKLDVPVNVIEKEMAKFKAGVRTPEPEEVSKPVGKRGRRENLERYVLAVGLHFEKSLAKHLKRLEPEWFSETYLKRLVEVIQKALLKNEVMDVAGLQKGLKSEMQTLVQELYGGEEELFEMTLSELERVFEKSRNDLEAMAARERMNRISKEMSKLKGDEEKLAKLQEEYRRLSTVLKGD